MNVISYPAAYQSAFRDACFVLDGISAAGGLDVGIYTEGNAQPLGVKRIYGSGQVAVNAAPYVRNLLSPSPLCDAGQGMISGAGRTVACAVGAGAYRSSPAWLTAGTEDAPLNTVLSACAGTARMRPGEKDEISVITGGGSVTPIITFRHEGAEYTCSSFAAAAGNTMLTFVVDADETGRRFSELTGADTSEMSDFTVWLRIKAGSSDVYLSRSYEVDRSAAAGRRLAWINRYGAIDYYTFPCGAGAKVSGNRERIYTSGGYRTVATVSEKSEELVSDAVGGATADWLAELFSSPQVWAVEGNIFERVEVAAGNATYSRRSPGAVSVSVTPAVKTVSRKS